MAAFGTTASVAIQGSNTIPEHILAPLINLTEPTRPFIREMLGFGDLNRDILAIKNNNPDRFNQASGAKGLDFFTRLNVKVPQRARFLEEEEAKVLRQQNVPDEYEFDDVDYSSLSTSGTFEVKTPGELISINTVLRYVDDDDATNTIIVTGTTRKDDNGAEIEYTHIDGDNGDITNIAGTNKNLYVVGVYNTETGRVEKQKYRSPSVETFGLSMIETPIEISSKAEVTKYDTQDKMAIAMAYKLAKSDFIRKQLNNLLLFAPSVSSVSTKEGNTFTMNPGITEVSGITTIDGSSSQLGPTVLETALDGLTEAETDQVPFERMGSVPTFDAFFGLDIARLFNNMLSTSASPFGTNLQTRFGEDTYDKNLKMWKGITGNIRLHYDRSFNNDFLKKKILIVNKNTVTVLFKKDHFMRLAPSWADSTHKVKTWVCTNELGLAVLEKTHVVMIEGLTSLET